jgi:flagellar protein FlbD
MIEVTRLNNIPIIINASLIECIEQTPDTVITITNGMKYVIKETPEEVVNKAIIFQQKLNSFPGKEKGE